VAKKNKRSAKEAKGKSPENLQAKRPHQKVKRQKAKVLENPMRSDRIKKAKGKRQKAKGKRLRKLLARRPHQKGKRQKT
jgi:hypothetical protein